MADISLHDLFAYDEASPSGLTWKITANSSTAKAGSHAGKKKKYGRNTYWSVAFKKKQYKAHRIVWELMTGECLPSNRIIDHIDGDGLNNLSSNLRVVDRAVNNRNTKRRLTIFSGLPAGISLHSEGLSFRARVTDLHGSRLSKSFSISKNGKEKALLLAVEWRDRRIRDLNSLGAGYTERHGK